MRNPVINALRPLVRQLPPLWRVYLRRWLQRLRAPAALLGNAYAGRVQEEVSRFATEEIVNDLPPIFHYWSNTYLRPRLETFGFANPEEFFAQQIARQYAALGRPVTAISLGAGNGDSEVAVARLLMARGIPDFRLHCLDITEAMLERGRRLAASAGVSAQLHFIAGDFNHWTPAQAYDVVIANQSLHHVSNLEGLFDAIHQAIGPQGLFATSDMIGRNGHQRWPEALKIVRQFWAELPAAYRYNRQLHRRENTFKDWNCALEGFEGIRAQDILPLALQRFGFDVFFAYGNLVDPFIDRSFGPHFDPERAWDRDFIDRVHARDEAEILAGHITPTHMLAVMVQDRAVQTRHWRHLTPEFCWRRGG